MGSLLARAASTSPTRNSTRPICALRTAITPGYCNHETDALIDRQSTEADPEKRRSFVWDIDRRLAQDASRPVLLYSRFATCVQPQLKGLTNSRFNGCRMEDVWLER